MARRHRLTNVWPKQRRHLSLRRLTKGRLSQPPLVPLGTSQGDVINNFSVHRAALGMLVATAIQFVFSISAEAAPVGKATSVVPAATYARGIATQTLAIDDPLQQNDRIKTSDSGSTQIRFIDDTILTIGPNSEVLLDRMVFDDNKAKNATVEIVRGTMRFVTGTSDHSAYQIKTPVATIGVRGTVIDVSYDGSQMLFNTVEGLGEVCHSNAGCRRVRAGDAPLAINLNGFSRASAAEVGRMFRNLNGLQRTLTRQASNAVITTTRAINGTARTIGAGVQRGIRQGLQWRFPN